LLLQYPYLRRPWRDLNSIRQQIQISTLLKLKKVRKLLTWMVPTKSQKQMTAQVLYYQKKSWHHYVMGCIETDTQKNIGLPFFNYKIKKTNTFV
jgi:hypothetical protein